MGVCPEAISLCYRPAPKDAGFHIRSSHYILDSSPPFKGHSYYWLPLKERASNCDFTHGYRLCILVSGSLIIDIFSCFTLIIVSCLYLGQNSGKFSSTVSSRILTRVLLQQTGHNIHSYLHTVPSLYPMFLLTTIILIPATLSCFPFISPHSEKVRYNHDTNTPCERNPNIIAY